MVGYQKTRGGVGVPELIAVVHQPKERLEEAIKPFFLRYVKWLLGTPTEQATMAAGEGETKKKGTKCRDTGLPRLGCCTSHHMRELDIVDGLVGILKAVQNRVIAPTSGRNGAGMLH